MRTSKSDLEELRMPELDETPAKIAERQWRSSRRTYTAAKILLGGMLMLVVSKVTEQANAAAIGTVMILAGLGILVWRR